MSFVEIIGFIISLLALIYLTFKQNSITRQRQDDSINGEEEDLMEEDPLKELMKNLEKKTVVRKTTPPLPPSQLVHKPKKSTLSYSQLEEYRLQSEIEKRKIKSPLENRQIKSKLSHRIEETSVHSITPSLHHLAGEKIFVGPARIQSTLNRLTKRQDLIIYQEIMDKPKGLRPFL